MKNTCTLNMLRPTRLETIRELPEDLRLCLGAERLLQFVLDAVQSVAPTARVLVSVGELNPRMLLTLLTYCYGSGIAGSEDVEWSAATEAAVRYICAGQIPSSIEIRRFRRENRPLLEQCLAHTLAAACAWNLSPNFSSPQWNERAMRDRDLPADGEIVLRARRVLDTAIQFDTAASE